MRSATLTIIAPGKGGAGMYSVNPRGKTCRVKHNWLRSANYTSSNYTISYLHELKTKYPKGSSFLSILDKSQINHSLVSGDVKKAAQIMLWCYLVSQGWVVHFLYIYPPPDFDHKSVLYIWTSFFLHDWLRGGKGYYHTSSPGISSWKSSVMEP